jgi:hypothetical protein
MNNVLEQNLEVQKQELTGDITLKSVFSKEQKLTIQPTRDPDANWYHGIEKLSDDDKKSRTYVVEPNSKLTIRHGMSFNLEREVDRLNWAWVQHCPAICMTFEEAQMTPGAIFYVENEEREALSSISRIELTHKAIDYVMNDAPSNWHTRALLCGFNMKGEKPLVVKERLLKLADNEATAQKVIDAYESSNLSVQLLFIEARNKNIITLDNGAFVLGDKVIGISQDSAIEWMKSPENKRAVIQIEKDLNPDLYPKEALTINPEEIGSVSLEELNEEEDIEEEPVKVRASKPTQKKKVVKKAPVKKETDTSQSKTE